MKVQLYRFSTHARSWPRAHGSICWLLVLFYLVASGRALIPGLCATLNAARADAKAARCDALANGDPSCCSQRALAQRIGDKQPVRPRQTRECGHCAFCSLVTSPAPGAPCIVQLPVPAETTLATPILDEIGGPRTHIQLAFQNRAPPTSSIPRYPVL